MKFKFSTSRLFAILLLGAQVSPVRAWDGATKIAFEEAVADFEREIGKLLKKGQLNEAVSILSEAAAATNSPEVWRLLGKAHFQAGHIPQAIYCYTFLDWELRGEDKGVKSWLDGALAGAPRPELRFVK